LPVAEAMVDVGLSAIVTNHREQPSFIARARHYKAAIAIACACAARKIGTAFPIKLCLKSSPALHRLCSVLQ
jgi:hypothetical protein